MTILVFKNSTDFIKYAVERADRNDNIIIGLSPDCFTFFSSGAWISGYFYKPEKGFTDHFTIYKNPKQKHGMLGGIETCEHIIKEIRKVTDQYYYSESRSYQKTNNNKKLSDLFK